MTLAEFRASGRNVADLGAEHTGLDLEGIAGRIYGPTAGPYIERHGDEYLLILGREQWLCPLARLPKMEAMLYRWARSEGVV